MEKKEKYEKIFLEGVIDRLEEEAAVFLAPDKSEIIIPKKHLPRELKEGGAAVIEIYTRADWEKLQERTAQDILNELFDQKSDEKKG